jgi:hypothetical protein
MHQEYKPPFDKLLSYTSPLDLNEWPNYLELGFTENHIDDLIEMALDNDLHESLTGGEEMWAPVHAWRTLGQLKALSAAQPLLELLSRLDDDFDDWIAEEIPMVMEMLGPESLATIQEYTLTNDDGIYANISALDSIVTIAKKYPEVKSECIDFLVNQLKDHAEQDNSYNGFLILYLTELKAIDSIDIIAEAFHIDTVDLTVMGDFEDVEIALELKTERTTPPPKLGFFDHNDEGYFAPVEKVTQVVRSSPKIGRNDPCPCGSGKKYKKCCL